MMPGMRGGLVTESFVGTGLREMTGVEAMSDYQRRALLAPLAALNRDLGPASSARSIADVLAIPLLRALGYEVCSREDTAFTSQLVVAADDRPASVIVSTWGFSPDALRQAAIASGIAADARWCFLFNGTSLRLTDAQRTWSRRHVEFDLRVLGGEPDTLTAFWALMRAAALAGEDPLLDRAVDGSARQGVAVCRALSVGVLDALRDVIQSLASGDNRRREAAPPADLLEQSLTFLYRLLFLLFAEARGLVPIWHPVYRERYTIDSIVTALQAGRGYRGIWEAVRSISHLAHAGCRAGDLRVTAFNGRLFSPARAPAVERRRVDDDTMARAVLAVSTTTNRRSGRDRILYHDLDVEQLGAVYEHLLDYEAHEGDAGGLVFRRRLTLARTGDLRKSTGTFYTPRSLTDYLVRRTLAPLVDKRTPGDILSLRVVDPAMGSGAFLVAACRYLAAAAERALIREGEWDAADVTDDDRIALRRDVAQRCLYGVDLNPMAVQLARLSLWLATLWHDKPLTFLDHHVVVGDSLVGASLQDLLSRPPGRSPRRAAALPLFANEGFDVMVGETLPTRLRLALERDDDAAVVKNKESLLAALRQRGNSFSRWKSVFDLWCACWFWPDGRPPDAATYGDLAARLLHDKSSLSEPAARPLMAAGRDTAAARGFLHWELEFPEVFYDDQGQRRPDAGFDAVLGNPPWDVVRADSGDATLRGNRRHHAAQLVAFVRDSGVYAASTGRSHTNRYQLFVERALQLSKPGGRIGLVLPSGVATDTGGGPLRRRLFDRAGVDSIVGLDNRAGIFPIHRGLRFVLLTATTGRRTEQVSCRFGVSTLDQLDAADDIPANLPGDPGSSSSGGAPVGTPCGALGTASTPGVLLSRSLIERLSGDDDLGIPEIASSTDLLIVERIGSTTPRLGAREGWQAEFGRELNASDDREFFVAASRDPAARVVLEGKQIGPFRVDLDGCRHELSAEAARTLRVPRRTRLAYRDVASATNRLTLIAAMVPARAVTTHTLFVLRTTPPRERQLALCALLNSYVANYLIRMRVNTHVTASLMARLPVPVPAPGGPSERLAFLADACLSATSPVESMEEYAEIQARAAHLYGVREDEFRHVLSTFPLVPHDAKSRSLAHFNSLR